MRCASNPLFNETVASSEQQNVLISPSKASPVSISEHVVAESPKYSDAIINVLAKYRTAPVELADQEAKSLSDYEASYRSTASNKA